MINFEDLKKKDSKKSEVVSIKKEYEEYILKFKQFIATKELNSELKYVYHVYDIIEGREVLKWTVKQMRDQPVKDYIDRCYGLSKTILNF